jgi:hypothetical protein
MRTPHIYLIALTLAVSSVSGNALAGNGKDKHKSDHRGEHKTSYQETSGVDIHVEVNFGKAVITTRERRIIREYYSGDGANFTNQKALPPGLRKQLQKTGRLPPGLEKRRMPSDLEHRLPRYDGPYERTIIGNDLILLDPKTGIILDVMQEIFNIPVDETLQKAGARRVSY